MTNPFTEAFDHPSALHSPCPFWFWNGDLEPDELLRQQREMHTQGIRAFVIHARVGLSVPYLSDSWFDRVGLVLDEAERLGMHVWIYDEDNWPSGYAGGRVLARDPAYRGQNLQPERIYLAPGERLDRTGASDEAVVAVLACRIRDVTSVPPDPLTFHLSTHTPDRWFDTARHRHEYALEAPTALPRQAAAFEAGDDHWCVFVLRQAPTDWIAAYSGDHYTDLLSDGATDAFIEATHQQYHARFARHFGRTILGFFVDEPGLYNNFWDRNLGSLSWTPDFAREFAARRGYDLLKWLPAVWEDLGEAGTRARLDYWLTVEELLHERFFGKLARWCEAHHVQLTGHLEWEEWLFTMTRHSASPFSALAPFHVPGVDRIDEVTDKLAEKLVASVAHANRRERVISESFALMNWKVHPALLRRVVDYQYVRGVNWLSPHGFYYSTDGFRTRECPPSEFFQNPWWPHSQPLWTYVTHLSAALTQGTHAAPVALYYPIEQAWATVTPDHPPASPPAGVWEAWQLPEPQHPAQRADRAVLATGLDLLDHQLDFDLVDHRVLANATVSAGTLGIGEERFAALVIAGVRDIAAATLDKAVAFAQAGGLLLFNDVLPTALSGEPSGPDWPLLLSQLQRLSSAGWVACGAGFVGFIPHTLGQAGAVLSQRLRPDADALAIQAPVTHVPAREVRSVAWREETLKPIRSVLKVLHRCAPPEDLYFISNESDQPLVVEFSLLGGPRAELGRSEDGLRQPLASVPHGAGRTALTLTFLPWQSHLVFLTPGAASLPAKTKEKTEVVLQPWTLTLAGQQFSGSLHSWNALGLGRFSGTGVYSSTFDLTALPSPGAHLELDLGRVLETARVTINGQHLPPLVWSPFSVNLTPWVQVGRNLLTVEVANTNANAWEETERLSGLIGPVTLHLIRNQQTSETAF